MRAEIPFGAQVARPADAVWAALTSGNGIDFLLGSHIRGVVGRQRPEQVGRRMAPGVRYLLTGGTTTAELELEVVACVAPHHFTLAGSRQDATGELRVMVDVEVSEAPGGCLVEVTSEIEFSSTLDMAVTQFAIVLRDLWDQRDGDSANLRRALEEAVPPAARARIPRHRSIPWVSAGTIGANAIAAALVGTSGTGLPGLALLYWTENLVIAAFCVARIFLARRVPGPVGRIVAALLFVAVFAPFWEMQADFVRSILGFTRYYEQWHSDLWGSLGSLQVIARFAREAWSASPAPGALAILVLMHGIWFHVDFLMSPARTRAHFGLLMREPALWLAVVQGGAILGILVATPRAEPALAVWIVAGIKTIVELVVRSIWRPSY